MKVKICGIRRYEDATVALDAGAWALGFIFHKPSKRYLDPEDAGRIIQRLPAGTLTIGVFVDWPLEDLNRAVEIAGLWGAQLHGVESLEYAQEVKVERVIKALRMTPDFRPKQVLEYPGCSMLLDAYQPGVPGGTGQTGDWSIAHDAARLRPLLLAGGMGPDNVVRAMEAVKPAGLDVSSGVESAPGIKDPEKIRRLFAEVAAHK